MKISLERLWISWLKICCRMAGIMQLSIISGGTPARVTGKIQRCVTGIPISGMHPMECHMIQQQLMNMDDCFLLLNDSPQLPEEKDSRLLQTMFTTRE